MSTPTTPRVAAVLAVSRAGEQLRAFALYWADVDSAGNLTGICCGTEGECSRRLFRTEREAITYGEITYGERARRMRS